MKMGMQTALTSFLLVRLVDALWASSIPFNISKFQKQLETELLCRSLVYRLVTPTTMDLAKRELAEGRGSSWYSGAGWRNDQWTWPSGVQVDFARWREPVCDHYLQICGRPNGRSAPALALTIEARLFQTCFKNFAIFFFVVNLPFKEQQQQEQQQHQHQEFCSTFGNRCCYRESGAQVEGHDSMASNDWSWCSKGVWLIDWSA